MIFYSCVQLLGARVPSMRTLNCVVVERFWRVLWVVCGLMIFFRQDRGGVSQGVASIRPLGICGLMIFSWRDCFRGGVSEGVVQCAELARLQVDIVPMSRLSGSGDRGTGIFWGPALGGVWTILVRQLWTG